jgi:hypothetical protein
MDFLVIPLSWYHVIMTPRCSLVYSVCSAIFKIFKIHLNTQKQALLSTASFDVSIIQRVWWLLTS